MIDKACAIVTRAAGASILAFRHPLAGMQLVKGTVEPGEAPQDAAARELLEESGLRTKHVSPITVSTQIRTGERWHIFHVFPAGDVPEAWHFDTHDGGGLRFAFFWQNLAAPMTGFEARYVRVLDLVRKHFA